MVSTFVYVDENQISFPMENIYASTNDLLFTLCHSFHAFAFAVAQPKYLNLLFVLPFVACGQMLFNSVFDTVIEALICVLNLVKLAEIS